MSGIEITAKHINITKHEMNLVQYLGSERVMVPKKVMIVPKKQTNVTKEVGKSATQNWNRLMLIASSTFGTMNGNKND